MFIKFQKRQNYSDTNQKCFKEREDRGWERTGRSLFKYQKYLSS